MVDRWVVDIISNIIYNLHIGLMGKYVHHYL